MYQKEDFVPMNWDKLVSNPDVFETIKEEMEKKFSAECLMTIITAAKEAGLKDTDIFMPIADLEEEDEEEEEDDGMPEYEDLEEDSIGDTTED
jgi:hypothetical protein